MIPVNQQNKDSLGVRLEGSMLDHSNDEMDAIQKNVNNINNYFSDENFIQEKLIKMSTLMGLLANTGSMPTEMQNRITNLKLFSEMAFTRYKTYNEAADMIGDQCKQILEYYDH